MIAALGALPSSSVFAFQALYDVHLFGSHILLSLMFVLSSSASSDRYFGQSYLKGLANLNVVLCATTTRSVWACGLWPLLTTRGLINFSPRPLIAVPLTAHCNNGRRSKNNKCNFNRNTLFTSDVEDSWTLEA
eukprot:3507378-Amphidinium_carterae.1